ncbi:MAG: hypothetical protein ACYDBQ_10565 [Thermoplasmatota archaeon]
MEMFRQALGVLEAASRRPLPELAWRPLPKASQGGRYLAVDGSHAVLADTGPVWVVAVRAAATPWPGPLLGEAPPMVVGTLADDAQEWLDRRWSLAGLEAPRAGSALAFAEAWRSIEEMEEARHALASGEGELVLVDGALHGLPQGAQALADLLLEAADVAGARLCAVAKRTTLARPGAGRAAVPNREGVHLARLHAQATHTYRVDLGGPEGDFERTWQDLVAASRDASYPGYPYPLAVAHNRVAFTGDRARALRYGLEDAARSRGGAIAALLADPHDILDRNL